jgi:hypothetical protein
MLLVAARLVACAGGVPGARMTSTMSRTSSAARRAELSVAPRAIAVFKGEVLALQAMPLEPHLVYFVGRLRGGGERRHAGPESEDDNRSDDAAPHREPPLDVPCRH